LPHQRLVRQVSMQEPPASQPQEVLALPLRLVSRQPRAVASRVRQASSARQP